jgi:hypothetical protein
MKDIKTYIDEGLFDVNNKPKTIAKDVSIEMAKQFVEKHLTIRASSSWKFLKFTENEWELDSNTGAIKLKHAGNYISALYIEDWDPKTAFPIDLSGVKISMLTIRKSIAKNFKNMFYRPTPTNINILHINSCEFDSWEGLEGFQTSKLDIVSCYNIENWKNAPKVLNDIYISETKINTLEGIPQVNKSIEMHHVFSDAFIKNAKCNINASTLFRAQLQSVNGLTIKGCGVVDLILYHCNSFRGAKINCKSLSIFGQSSNLKNFEGSYINAETIMIDSCSIENCKGLNNTLVNARVIILKNITGLKSFEGLPKNIQSLTLQAVNDDTLDYTTLPYCYNITCQTGKANNISPQARAELEKHCVNLEII